MVFSDADFTAADFALAGLVFARGLFVFATEVFFLGALGSVALEVAAAGAHSWKPFSQVSARRLCRSCV